MKSIRTICLLGKTLENTKLSDSESEKTSTLSYQSLLIDGIHYNVWHVAHFTYIDLLEKVNPYPELFILNLSFEEYLEWRPFLPKSKYIWISDTLKNQQNCRTLALNNDTAFCTTSRLLEFINKIYTQTKITPDYENLCIPHGCDTLSKIQLVDEEFVPKSFEELLQKDKTEQPSRIDVDRFLVETFGRAKDEEHKKKLAVFFDDLLNKKSKVQTE